MKDLKVLIVEDDKISANYLTIILERISKEIITVTNATEAIETCKNQPDINLILMDIKLPQIDGYKAAKRIREFNKDVIIIAETAYTMKGDRQRALDAGCNDYIAKPILEEKLYHIINQYIK